MIKNTLLFYRYLVFIISLGCFFPRLCFGHNFFPQEYSTQIRLGSAYAKQAKSEWYYTDIFIPIYSRTGSIAYGTHEFLFFANPKVTTTTASTNEENVGLGVRYLTDDLLFNEEIIIGANVFFDTKYSTRGMRHNQLGTGIEFLSRQVDLRFNYYQPVSSKKIYDTYYAFGEESLMKHYAEEEPLPGFDYELGFLVPFISNFIETKIYGGGYQYNATINQDIAGTKARLELYPSSFLTLCLESKNDSVRGNEMFIGGHITIPFDLRGWFERKNPLRKIEDVPVFRKHARSIAERMTEPIVRDLDIITVEKSYSEKTRDVIFVNNSNDGDSNEDGSLSHPHNTLAEALSNPRYQDGTWVYIAKGDGSKDGYTGSFTLADNTVLWGEGYQYCGLGGGGYPIIDGNAADKAITLGQGNTVMGLQIQNGNNGIYGENITSLVINNNIITDNGTPYGSGITLIRDDGGNCLALIDSNTISSNAGNGVSLQSENFSTFSCTISSNTISLNSGSGITQTSGGLITGDTSSLATTFSGNIISGNSSNGISMHTNWAATMPTIVTRNKIYSNVSDGIELEDLGTSVITLDVGGGELNSEGYNSIYSNSGYAINNTTLLTVKAENNWWGRTPPVSSDFKKVDYSPWLSSDPF
ncbi:MAG: inverse autotransporter beta domain-containing protein [Candidatus Omnitrophota bacterium]